MDAVQAAGDGHPGTAMSLAPAAYLLFQEFLRHDPTDPDWVGRDRFVLSCGHSSLTLYIQLYLSGYGLTLEDLKLYRQWGSRTPGHPEHGHTLGVETTTGPLGSGHRQRGRHGDGRPARARAARPRRQARRERLRPHHLGASSPTATWRRASRPRPRSLAGHQRLGNLVVLYDDNHISIEGNTDVAFSEDVAARYAAYGWHVQRRRRLRGRRRAAQGAARRPRTRPAGRASSGCAASSASRRRTLQNTGKAHGSALGADEVAATKEVMGLDPQKPASTMPDEVLAHAREVVDRGRDAHAAWDEALRGLAEGQPRPAPSCSTGCSERRLPDGWEKALPVFHGRRRRAWPPARPPARCSPRSPTCCPSCGAARPTSPAATTRR